jgi:hypothetical protein
MVPFCRSHVVSIRSLSFILLSLMVLTLQACHAQSSKPDIADTPTAAEQPRAKPPIGTRMPLTLVGYNYTNRYIDEFDVDGEGGGNLFVSDGRIGGGKSACCVSYVSGAGGWKTKIRWQTGACTYNERISHGEKFNDYHMFFREVDVQVDPNIPDFPRYFEVHIYPDGHAEAAITEHQSPARLLLGKDRKDTSHYPRCPNDKKPN